MAESRKNRLSFPDVDILLPNRLTTYLLIKPNRNYESSDVGKMLSKVPGAEKVHMTAGRYAFLVEMRMSTKEQTEKTAKKLLLSQQISEVDALVVVPRIFRE